jgi:hypothetical protein
MVLKNTFSGGTERSTTKSSLVNFVARSILNVAIHILELPSSSFGSDKYPVLFFLYPSRQTLDYYIKKWHVCFHPLPFMHNRHISCGYPAKQLTDCTHYTCIIFDIVHSTHPDKIRNRHRN